MDQYLFVPDVVLSRWRYIDYNYFPFNLVVLKRSGKFRTTSMFVIPRYDIRLYHLCKLLPRADVCPCLHENNHGDLPVKLVRTWINWKWDRNGEGGDSPMKFVEGRLLERTTPFRGENIFSTSRPSPIDSVIDHSVEAWNRRKQSTGAFELSHWQSVHESTSMTNAEHGVNSNEIHREWTFLKLNDITRKSTVPPYFPKNNICRFVTWWWENGKETGINQGDKKWRKNFPLVFHCGD